MILRYPVSHFIKLLYCLNSLLSKQFWLMSLVVQIGPNHYKVFELYLVLVTILVPVHVIMTHSISTNMSWFLFQQQILNTVSLHIWVWDLCTCVITCVFVDRPHRQSNTHPNLRLLQTYPSRHPLKVMKIKNLNVYESISKKILVSDIFLCKQL